MRWFSVLAAALFASVAQAEEPAVPTVLTFDNGEFNTPLYTPRWNGRFTQPSVAQEIVTSVGRVLGEHPQVHSYLPPGRVEGRPGQPYAVLPSAPGCEGPAEQAGDSCWCAVGERCWTDLGANYHPGGSTSLYLTAASVRAQSEGPRVEVHFTDLFEEDPSSVDNPDDSDRCVTRTGTRKAIEGLLNVGEDAQLDHLAVGVLTVEIAPPPPGPSHGFLYGLNEAEGGCWSGAPISEWETASGAQNWSMAVVVLGLNTADSHEQVLALLDGLDTQFDSEQMTLSMVQVVAPAQSVQLDAALSLAEIQRWKASAASGTNKLPCESATAEATLLLGEQPVDAAVSSDCSGNISMSVTPVALRAAWARGQGLWPTAGDETLTGAIQVTGDATATATALAKLGVRNDQASHRPLPFWGEAVRTLTHSQRSAGRSYLANVTLKVGALDDRPWLMYLLGGGFFGLVLAAFMYKRLLAAQADRAFRSHWDAALAKEIDPMKQTPVALVLAAAQQDVRAKWPQRVLVSATLGIVVFVAAVGGMASIFLTRMAHG